MPNEVSPKRRSKTVFRIAHPPPRSKHQQRFHIPPRRYLQLQQLSKSGHGMPFLDVVPATHHRHLKPGRAGGSEDIVVVNSSSDETREVDSEALAVVRCSNKSAPAGVAICMANGAMWKANKLRSGSYEFVNEDDHGPRQCARWAVKRAMKPDSGSKTVMKDAFTFSVLTPNERRHAVIAKLNAGGVEIWDQYRSVEETEIETSDDMLDAKSSSSDGESEVKNGKMQYLSQDLRLFILASAMWVSLNEGFSPHWSSNQTKTKTSGSDAQDSCEWAKSQRQAPLTRSVQSSPLVPQSGTDSSSGTRSRRSFSSAAALGRTMEIPDLGSNAQAPAGRGKGTNIGEVSDGAVEATAEGAMPQGDHAKSVSRPLERGSLNESTWSKSGKHERRLSSLFRSWHKGR